MSMLKQVQGAIAGAARVLARRRGAEEFTCGDCDRWRRCGLESSENCVARAAQMERIAREGGRRPVYDVIVSSGPGWTYTHR